jgi:DNA-binding transcriptional MerR regulator
MALDTKGGAGYMPTDRAIPPGYMTVGTLAKKMNTTVRTLQYYDKEGLLSPSAESEGGRRLYTDKDVVTLYQIQSMKYLGFSLDDIKNHLVALDTPEQVAAVLTEQANAVREKIASLSEVLEIIETLKEETLHIQTVNFRKYADLVAILKVGNENYWAVKLFSDDLWAHIRDRFDEESAKDYKNRQKILFAEAVRLKSAGTSPESGQGLAIGKEWLEMLIEFTGGDMSMIPEMQKFAEHRDLWDGEWRKSWEGAEEYITAALGAYITTLGYNPFEGVMQS